MQWPAVEISGGLAFALEFQGGEVFLIQFGKPFLFRTFHVDLKDLRTKVGSNVEIISEKVAELTSKARRLIWSAPFCKSLFC